MIYINITNFVQVSKLIIYLEKVNALFKKYCNFFPTNFKCCAVKKNQDLLIVFVVHLLKIKREFKNL